VIPKPAVQCDSQLWILKEDRTEAPGMRFLRPLLCVSLRVQMRSTDITKQLGTERKLKQIQECQIKRNVHLERMPPERFPFKHIFITALKRETLNFKE
jgi:hypothetical protein